MVPPLLICDGLPDDLFDDCGLRRENGSELDALQKKFVRASSTVSLMIGQNHVTELFFAPYQVTTELLIFRRQFSCVLTEEIFYGCLPV